MDCSVLEADGDYLGLAEHIGQVDVIHTVDLDYAAVLAVAELRRDGVPPAIAARYRPASPRPSTPYTIFPGRERTPSSPPSHPRRTRGEAYRSSI